MYLLFTPNAFPKTSKYSVTIREIVFTFVSSTIGYSSYRSKFVFVEMSNGFYIYIYVQSIGSSKYLESENTYIVFACELYCLDAENIVRKGINAAGFRFVLGGS